MGSWESWSSRRSKINGTLTLTKSALVVWLFQLLADFTVSFNTTRVVVVTYSSKDQVIRQVDHISSPSPHFQKCFLLDEEIPAISYNSGGTYTLGALEQALDVLQVWCYLF